MTETPRDRGSDEGRTPNLNPADFGISDQEIRDMQGRAFGEHLYDGLEMALTGEKGGFKAAVDADALKRMRSFPAHMVKYDEDGSPYVHHKTGKWASTWSGGGYIDHTHDDHGTLDVTNVTDYNDPNQGPFTLSGPSMNPQDFIKHHENFLGYVKENYPKHMQ